VSVGGNFVVFSCTTHISGYANNEIYYRELTVLGSYSPAPEDLKESLELLASGKVNVKGLSTEYPLENIGQAFEDAVSNKILKACIAIAGGISQ
jgi:L-iditol 2-dehydrogenase